MRTVNPIATRMMTTEPVVRNYMQQTNSYLEILASYHQGSMNLDRIRSDYQFEMAENTLISVAFK